MSFLDIIKDLFCGKKCEKTETEQHSETAVKQQVKSEPTPAPIVSKSAPKKQQTAVSLVPEDSTLRRHYLANLEALKQPKAASPVVKKQESATVAPIAIKTPIEKIDKSQIPEDATLKRHFISALKNKIEADMPDCPTDPTLKRHFDATVQAELDRLLG